MNPKYLGDSYDIVKRFFCAALRDLGYRVYIEPRWTGEWAADADAFYRFLGVEEASGSNSDGGKSALFVDPDTGIHATKQGSHVSFDDLGRRIQQYELVFAFDQSFSRQFRPLEQMKTKLALLENVGSSGLYYQSHASFLFVSRSEVPLNDLRSHLEGLGLPAWRLVPPFPPEVDVAKLSQPVKV